MELIFILFMKEDAGKKCMKRLVLQIADSNSNRLPKQKVVKNTKVMLGKNTTLNRNECISFLKPYNFLVLRNKQCLVCEKRK